MALIFSHQFDTLADIDSHGIYGTPITPGVVYAQRNFNNANETTIGDLQITSQFPDTWGGKCFYVKVAHNATNNDYRKELGLNTAGGNSNYKIENGTTVWISGRFRLDGTTFFPASDDAGAPLEVNQIKAHDNTVGSNPVLANLGYRKGYLSVSGAAMPSLQIIQALNPIAVDTWINYVIHFKLDKTNGFYKIWTSTGSNIIDVGATPDINVVGATQVDWGDGCKVKCGMYVPHWNGKATPDKISSPRAFWYDGYQLGDSNETLTSMQFWSALGAGSSDTVEAPVFSPATTSSSGSIDVTITADQDSLGGSLTGVTIHYTLDGSVPTTGSSSIPSGSSVTILSSAQLSAIGVKATYQNSEVTTGLYTITNRRFSDFSTEFALGGLFFLDTFTGTGTLDAHTPDLGGVWDEGAFNYLLADTIVQPSTSEFYHARNLVASPLNYRMRVRGAIGTDGSNRQLAAMCRMPSIDASHYQAVVMGAHGGNNQKTFFITRSNAGGASYKFGEVFISDISDTELYTLDLYVWTSNSVVHILAELSGSSGFIQSIYAEDSSGDALVSANHPAFRLRTNDLTNGYVDEVEGAEIVNSQVISMPARNPIFLAVG